MEEESETTEVWDYILKASFTDSKIYYVSSSWKVYIYCRQGFPQEN